MIGTTPTVAEIVTVPLVRRIKEAHPQLCIRFSSAYSGHLMDWLQRGELELAVSYDPQPLRSLRILPVMMENFLLVSAGSVLVSFGRTSYVRTAPGAVRVWLRISVIGWLL